MLSRRDNGSPPRSLPQGLDSRSSRLVRGQVVEVRPASEILATLDADLTCEGLPFMPEMLKYCGRRMTVHRRADMTCVEGRGIRSLSNAVLLTGSHCDGAAHGGCQRNCLIFWKEAWLVPVDGAETLAVDAPPLDDVYRALARGTSNGSQYRCQSTLLHQATAPLPRFSFFLFFREIADGELSVAFFLRIVGRTLHNRLRAVLGMTSVGSVSGPRGPHPKGDLELRPGECVEVRSLDEISRTIGPTGKNHGLVFDANMTAYVGQKFEVACKFERMISEETGEMVTLTNTVALKNVRCTGMWKNCPRAQPYYWREAWLKRV